MLRVIKGYLFHLVVLICIASFSGCAGRNYLIVDYQVPTSSHELDGQMVRLQVEDARQSGSILSSEAAYQFPEFSGIYSLAWILPSQERVLAGEHQLMELFKTVFEKRLAALGVSTVYTDDEKVALLTITLKQFRVDLQSHKWMADLSYDAVLTQPNHPIAKENIHGSAERARIIGRKGADTVLSDIFSDVVNRLDFPKLFRNAKLIP
jgi:hypothetical protein